MSILPNLRTIIVDLLIHSLKSCTCRANHFDGEIFTPPNLLNGDGSLAKRPVIKAAPRTVGHAGIARIMAITTDSPVKRLNIIRRGCARRPITLSPSADHQL